MEMTLQRDWWSIQLPLACFFLLAISAVSLLAEHRGNAVIYPMKGEHNGIGIGETKVYDNRSLMLIIEQLDASLARISVLDQSKLIQGIGALQGIQQSEAATSVSASMLPIAGSQFTEERDATAGTLVPKQRVTTNPAVTPSAPTLSADGLPAITPGNYGIAAQDILSEQMDLTYQIANLRMLLERSITDRMYKVATTNGARAQAVLGFPVSLDPLNRHRNHAAIIEVEITPRSTQRTPSLVAMMPQAKTYNTAALSRKVNAFSAAAVVKVISVGLSSRRSSQSYYLYRDTDTVAFQRSSRDGKLVFGWQFRPVLNRTAVEPGLRQTLCHNRLGRT